MRVLVIGANGQLGWEIVRQGLQRGQQIDAVDLPMLDITDPKSVERMINRLRASFVINAAAYTAVDQAESEPEIAYKVNTDGPAHLALICAKTSIPLIHISTDYVFDGSKEGVYRETDPVASLGVYGKSKAAGEREVRDRLKEHIILRTSWLYGVHGNNFVKTMLRLGRERNVLRVVADQYGCPTYAADLAGAILDIAECFKKGKSIKWGTYHYCGSGVTTWHGLAEAFFDIAQKHTSLMVTKVEAITTGEYPTLAKRPANSAMDCSLIKDTFGICPLPWKVSLVKMTNELFGR